MVIRNNNNNEYNDPDLSPLAQTKQVVQLSTLVATPLLLFRIS